MKNRRIIEGLRFLNDNGLSLVSILDTQTLPSSLAEGIREQDISLEEFPRLILLANGGPRFWESFSADRPQVEHPMDHFSIQLTERFFKTYLPFVSTIQLYPQAYQLPIQQISRFAGWSFPSPLGMDIHSEFGLWYAYRSIYLVGTGIPPFNDTYDESPCENCQDKPCFEACSSGAVRGIEKFEVSTCITHRLTDNSPCAENCPARMACPVGSLHRYSTAQMSYHYLYSLHAYQRYYADKNPSS